MNTILCDFESGCKKHLHSELRVQNQNGKPQVTIQTVTFNCYSTNIQQFR